MICPKCQTEMEEIDSFNANWFCKICGIGVY
jgi:transcription initiation factor TFIIIB Brf1 subunit/transcription initiation factor TFIIB